MELSQEQPQRRTSARRQANERRRQERQRALQQEFGLNQQQSQINSNQDQNQDEDAQVNPIHMEIEQEQPESEEEKVDDFFECQEQQQQPLNPILQNEGQINHGQQQQVNNQQIFPHQGIQQRVQKITPTQFLEKIPNRDILLDFYQNKCQMYCPPLRDMNKKFCADVFAGKKFLLKQSEVKRISNAPNFKEFSVKNIWFSVQQHSNRDSLLKYFPEYQGKTLPSKKFLINVINTLDRGLVEKTLKDIRKRKEKKQLESKPVLITEFFSNMLRDFEPLSTNTHKIGIGNIIHFDLDTCNICLEEMKNNQSKKLYKCKNHKGHSLCVNNYQKSLRNNEKYLCPLRCPNPEYQANEAV